ncbi:hypothetical protein JVU11DRAFT_5716 [Chiua virens]|nr:hypothetical protein JVU11DRAFT_5716 [Chiua virens]
MSTLPRCPCSPLVSPFPASDASELHADTLSLTQKPEPLTLGPSDTLKLTFQVTESDEGKGVQPHQTFLRFYDPISGEEGIQPVRVTLGGKAKFELNMAHPPPSFPPTTSDPLEVSLILGSFVHDPAIHDLFDLYVPASTTPYTPPRRRRLPSPTAYRTHLPARTKSPPQDRLRLFLRPRPRTVGRLVGFVEPSRRTRAALIFASHRALYNAPRRVLLYAGILALPTIFAGKTALATTGKWRTGKQ